MRLREENSISIAYETQALYKKLKSEIFWKSLQDHFIDRFLNLTLFWKKKNNSSYVNIINKKIMWMSIFSRHNFLSHNLFTFWNTLCISRISIISGNIGYKTIAYLKEDTRTYSRSEDKNCDNIVLHKAKDISFL